jgi:tetratricopeptide (TPR) repeat protein
LPYNKDITLKRPEYLNRLLIHIALIGILGFLAYSNTFHSPFQFDSVINIVRNPVVKDFEYFTDARKAEGLKTAQPWLYHALKGRYLGYLTFALNHKFHGLEVTGYHVLNLLIHLLNAFLVYLFVMLTFRTHYFEASAIKESSGHIALFSALLFVSHPVQTQAVTYIVQRLASLAAFFYLLSLLAYIKSRLHARKVSRYAFCSMSFVSAAIAVKTKEISVTLPAMIILYELMFFRGKLKSRILYAAPFMAIVLLIPFAPIGMDASFGDVMEHLDLMSGVRTTISRLDYLFTQFRVIVTYIRLLFLPVNQSLDYDYPLFHSSLNLQVLMSFLFLASILGIGGYFLHRSKKSPALRLGSFGLFWFFVALVPESSVFPIADVIFEHRAYLPSIGVFIFTACILFHCASKSRRYYAAMIYALTAIVIALTILTYSRNLIWQDEIRLWSDVASKAPNKRRGILNLGVKYQHKGFPEKAMEQFHMPVELKQETAESYNNMAVVYASAGRYEMAVSLYLEALRLRPDYPEAFNNLGISRAALGKYEDAISSFGDALKLNPAYPEAFNNLGNVYLNLKEYGAAEKNYFRALEIKPGYPEARYNLIKVYLLKGDKKKAVDEFHVLEQTSPEHARKLLVESSLQALIKDNGRK